MPEELPVGVTFGGGWVASEAVDKLFPALVQALANLPDIPRERTANTGTYSYRYADIGDMLERVRPHLAAYDLAALTPAGTDANGRATATTTIIHVSGQWMTFDPLALPGGNTAQSFGSAITYARRYSLGAALGISFVDDDDGAAAQSHQPQTQQRANDRGQATFRSASEADIRRRLALLPGNRASHFTADFRERFGCGLADLPVERHVEARDFLDYWLTGGPGEAALEAEQQEFDRT